MRDPVLGGMVANGARLGLPLTLLSGGVVVEGVTATEPAWFDRLAELLEAPGSPGASEVAKAFRGIRMAVELDGIAHEAEAGSAGADFVHLVDATLRAGGELQSVGLWRVDLDAVDGWKLGRALPTKSSLPSRGVAAR